jgi:dTDP-4-amino-4,6-dideoxygalactose transaminase
MSNMRAGLNLNGNDLAAAIGRLQLRRLPGIIARRRQVAHQIQQAIGGLRAVRPGREVGGDGSVYWFMRFCVDESLLTVDKDAFAKAVAAEGIPVGISYRHIPSEAQWFKERCVFPGTDYPWGLPDYKGDREAQFPCPNAVAAAESHFILSIHENFGDGEVEDIVAAFAKVEGACLR